MNYIIFYDQNILAKHVTRQNHFFIAKFKKLRTLKKGKINSGIIFLAEVLIFAAANTFFQLNLVFIAKSRTGFRSGILWKYELKVRSSHWSYSVKIGVLKYFANFTEKHLCWSLFLTASSGLQPFKKVSPTQVFSFWICKNFKDTYFEENLWTTASETCLNFSRAALFW